MTLARAWMRTFIVALVAAALLAAPVVRAFAESGSVPSRHAALSSGGGAKKAHVGLRAPRLRRLKQTVLAVISSGPVLPVPSSSRRAAPAARRSARAPSRAALPDHPPA
ncbi:MAG: hypothetical protein ACHQ51_03890 [Elusimicrobiota bacterium]